MDNPYQSPAPNNSSEPAPPPNAPPETIGMARQIRVVAVLMMVQGSLDVLMAIGLIVLTVFMGNVFEQAINDEVQKQQAQREAQPDQDDRPEFKAQPINEAWLRWWVFGIYGTMALVHAAVGITQIVAGWLNYRYRKKTFGMIALVMGSLTFIACYCVPTSIALLVYGLIVYLHVDSARAFAASEPAT